MKKSLLLIISVLAGSMAFAQSQRTVLVEEFTQASCPPCATQNPTFNTLLDANPGKVIPLKYQTSWPGVDPMNTQTQSLVGPRVTYYSVSGVPMTRVDGDTMPVTGSSYTGAPANFNQTKLNAAYAIPSPFSMSMSHSFNATHDSIFITLDIACTQAITGTSMKCRVALTEKDISFCSAPGTNGEMVFEEVMRAMYPNATGTTIANAWTLGQTQTLTFSQKLPTYIYDVNELDVVAFIQDDGNKDVHQAAYSAPQPLANDARLNCGAVTGIPSVSCGTPINPIINFKNLGASILISLDINYQIDGGTVTTVPWTGSLASGAAGTITLPTLSLGAGSHSIHVTCTNPNGSTDINVTYDSWTTSFTISSGTGSSLPLVQAFTAGTFPPTSWSLLNPDGSYTWTRSTAGFNGAGSAKIDFYNSASGQIDELWTANYDFSVTGTTTAQIDFDVAYSQYAAENDNLKVDYSINCGQTWVNVFNEQGTVLASGNPPYGSGPWTPTLTTQWHHKTALLNGAVNNSSVFVRYKGTSAFGNNCYVDNINVSTNLTTSLPSVPSSVENVGVYPNPSNGDVTLKANFDQPQDMTVTVTNLLGEVIKTFSVKNASGDYSLDLKSQPKGNYFVNVKTANENITKRISITE